MSMIEICFIVQLSSGLKIFNQLNDMKSTMSGRVGTLQVKNIFVHVLYDLLIKLLFIYF